MGLFKKINKLGKSPVKKKSSGSGTIPLPSQGSWMPLGGGESMYMLNSAFNQPVGQPSGVAPSVGGQSLVDKWAAARKGRTGSTGYLSGGAAGYVPGQDPGGYWGQQGGGAQANAFAQAQRRGEADLGYARGLAGKVMSQHEARNAMGAGQSNQLIRDVINSGRRRQQVADALLENPLSYNEQAKQQMYEGAAGQINTAYQQGENQLLRGMAGRGAVTPAQREAALARMSMGKGEALGGARREIETGAALQRPTDIINALGAGNMTGQTGMNLAGGRQNMINAQLQGSIAAQQPMQNILAQTTYNPFNYGSGGGGVSSDSLTSFLQKYFPG